MLRKVQLYVWSSKINGLCNLDILFQSHGEMVKGWALEDVKHVKYQEMFMHANYEETVFYACKMSKKSFI